MLNVEVVNALEYVYAWTESVQWPVNAVTFAARVGVDVQFIASNDEFVACVGDGADDRVFYCVWDWVSFVPVEGVLAVHCTQRALRCGGFDAQKYELVARVCYALSGHLCDRSSIDWMIKIARLLRGEVA